jgi:hypothetical protein
MDSADFIELVTRRGLADAVPLWQYLADNGGAKGLPTDVNLLAERFVSAGLLTPLQAERALAGQAASLAIGPFQLVERIGGDAYLARRRQGKPAVLKPASKGVPPTLPGHPNLVQAHAVDGADWLVMERALGKPLSQMRLAPVQAARAVVNVASALAHLHAAGLVHGRVSAEHILAGPEGDAVLLHPSARPTGTREDDLRNLAGALRGGLADTPPALEALMDKMDEGELPADEVVSLLTEWLQVVAPPVMIVPNRRSSATDAMRPPEEEPAPVEEEQGPEWMRWALLAGAGAGLGLAGVCWMLLR